VARLSYLRVLLTVAAIAVAVSHAKWPTLRIDGVTLGLIVLAVLPWLAPIIKSIELPGIGKIELQEVKAQVEELRGQAASASQKADTALTNTIVAPQAAALLTSEQRYLALSERYNDIRKTQKPSDLRTAAMTNVVGEMISLASSGASVKVVPFLTDRDDGKRLFAYAHIYAHPDPRLLPDLVRSVTQVEDKPFGQYWGIQAIGRVIQAAPDSVDVQTQVALRQFLTKLKRGTDRHYELSRILRSLEGST
jgi:hypothetical protein